MSRRMAGWAPPGETGEEREDIMEISGKIALVTGGGLKGAQRGGDRRALREPGRFTLSFAAP